MFFRNHSDSLISMSTTQWDDPTQDPSIPTTGAEERGYVPQLIKSLCCIDRGNDSKGFKYIKCFVPGATVYPPEAFEACAWRIVHEAKKIHIPSFLSIVISDRGIIKAIEETKNPYLDEHTYLLCRMIEVAVNRCKDEKFTTTIAAPLKPYASSLTIFVFNKTKADHIKLGKAAAPKNYALEETGVGSPAQFEDEDIAARYLLVLCSSINLDAVNRRDVRKTNQ
ncbi:hypothetical protein BU25DRAFT_478744 [Macroventuria anomochaeta]|uniref:Uncharacterized protein n=1 Tax=Macroventuria anomochaeta TaxID=301207 RepID=A0ACB6RMG4_9PLEO|nr:uncharacterized protein BU25DRAFT_478744 [Macroventuria anomochaeta]KAF2623150.1 hypothetical protein BU25DRAFT_478744 [Macroventuria anomochaeta]